MANNIFVNHVFVLILAVFAISCTPKIDIDTPAGRSISVAPSTDDMFHMTLICNSDVKQYVKVFFSLRNHLGVLATGDFSVVDTVKLDWYAREGQVQLAFRAVRLLNNIPPPVFSREEGVTFDVTAILTTPSDGARVNWSGLHGVRLTNANEFWRRTVTAINDGLPGETPGTGTTRYLNFRIAENEFGPWSLATDWRLGNIFPDQTEQTEEQ